MKRLTCILLVMIFCLINIHPIYIYGNTPKWKVSYALAKVNTELGKEEEEFYGMTNDAGKPFNVEYVEYGFAYSKGDKDYGAYQFFVYGEPYGTNINGQPRYLGYTAFRYESTNSSVQGMTLRGIGRDGGFNNINIKVVGSMYDDIR